MTFKDELVEFITDVGTDWKNIWAKLGTVTLQTAAQTVSGAINELRDEITSLVPEGASTTTTGVVRLATDAEAAALGVNYVATTPANLGYLRGRASGLAALDGTGKVPATQLPSYVDDVVEAANFAALPGAGEAGKIYVTLDNGKTFRWGGSAYAEISASPGSTDAVSEGATSLYYTQARADARADARIAALVGDTNTDLAALYAAAKA